MSTLNYNIPCFAPPFNYRHKIDPNAAWVSLRPSSPCFPVARRRLLLPPSNSAPVTPWGTPMPVWQLDDHVLVQLYSPSGEWHHAVILEVLPPIEVDTLSTDELKEIPPV
ncbi:unnamed protein product [Rhizoctonia solani]|uniref:Uncharacterized protein n=1 Tax=Rhizoctonia solani TaxID=456999 RepID=A0A8H2WEM1_9AGAM|nr:unnamed protein product [Rhizoctonia solani]